MLLILFLIAAIKLANGWTVVNGRTAPIQLYPPPNPPASPPQLPYDYKPDLSDQERKAQLGRSTWTLLHTIAAVYPEEPSEEDQKYHLALLTLLARLYPCAECGEHWRSLLKESPPELGSKFAFNLWLCRLHNKVNLSLGKPEFDCSRLNDRWRCGCELSLEKQ